VAAADPGLLKSACALEGMEVRTAAGRRLGHVFDLRLRTDAGAAPVLAAIVYGSRGLLERLGLRHAKPTLIAWERVGAVEGRAIIVDDDAAPRATST
jgi:sporulation protein YlmC with PRC-barrel domain